jgi:hypothetical protein
MSIVICHNCDKRLRIPDGARGKLKCPACGKMTSTDGTDPDVDEEEQESAPSKKKSRKFGSLPLTLAAILVITFFAHMFRYEYVVGTGDGASYVVRMDRWLGGRCLESGVVPTTINPQSAWSGLEICDVEPVEEPEKIAKVTQ